MKIVIVTGIFPPDAGGPSSYLSLVSDELVKKGYHVTVITLSDRHHYQGLSFPFPVIRIPRKGLPLPVRFALTAYKICAAALKADVLFVNGLEMEARIANTIARRPSVLKVAGDAAWERARHREWVSDDLEEFNRRRYSWAIEGTKLFRNAGVRWADYLIVTSGIFGAIVRQWADSKQNIQVIPNSTMYEPDNQKSATIPLSCKHLIITVCRLVNFKGVETILKVLQRMPDCGLVIVGEGPYRLHLEEFARKTGVAGRVHFTGRVEGCRIFDYLKACDVFVLGSQWETFGISILEAMSAGIPIICTGKGGMAEIVRHGKNGLVYQYGDDAALADALKVLFSDQELCRRLIQAGENTCREFSGGKMVARTLALLNTAADNHE